MDERLDALEKRVVELETELKRYKDLEWDRWLMAWGLCFSTKVAALTDADPASLSDEVKDRLFKQEYRRRLATLEAVYDTVSDTTA